MRICLLIVFFISYVPLSAQHTYNADSVESIFETLPDSVRIREANNLMKYYMDVNVGKSMAYAKKAFALTKRTQNKNDIAYTFVSWAIAQYDHGYYDSAVLYNLKALEIYQSFSDTAKIAVVYNNLGSASNALGDYASGAYYAYKAFLIHSAKQTWGKAAISCLNLSSAYYESGDYDSALTWARRGYDYYTGAGATDHLGYAAQLFVDVFIAQENIDSASYYTGEISRLLQSYPNEYLETINLTQRGQIFAIQAHYDSAITLYAKCLRFYEEMEMPDAVLHTHLSIAKAQMGLKKWDVAEQSAMHALVRSKNIRNKPMIAKSYALLSEILTAQGKLISAAEHLRLSGLYKDSIMSQSVRGNIEGRFLDIKLEQETQARLAALMNLEHSNAMVSNQWKLIAAISAILLLTAAVAYSARRAAIDRKRMNKELLASNQKLVELNREINGLVNTIVHDLKSPLNSVQGILSLIQMNGAGDGKLDDLVATANKSLANGHEIIRELLTLRELEENSGQTNFTRIDVPELIRELYGNFLAMAQQKEITLTMTADPCALTSDKALLRRVLDNLISNALKFSFRGGVVTITAIGQEDRVIFRVEDHGPGFSQEDLTKIYGKFQKLSARPTAGEQSNGLGLATVQALAKHLNGVIELDTRQGRGSVFTIGFPVRCDPSP